MTSTTMKAQLIRIKIERGKSGLLFATSPDLKGLYVGKRTVEELEQAIPEIIAELYAACDVHVVVTKVEDSTHGDASPWVAIPISIAREALLKVG
jgi:hypothetical protein